MDFGLGPGALIGGLAGTIGLLMPGFIFVSVFAQGVRWSDMSREVFTVLAAMVGLVFHLIAAKWTLWLWTAVLDAWEGSGTLGWPEAFHVIAWTLIVLLALPAAGGVALRRLTSLRSPKRIAQLFDALNMSKGSLIATAWDYQFQTDAVRRGTWVRVRTRTGEGGALQYLGMMGSRSFAGSRSDQPDLYLQATVATDAFGEPVPGVAPTEGVWIAGDQIAAIEFLGPGER